MSHERKPLQPQASQSRPRVWEYAHKRVKPDRQTNEGTLHFQLNRREPVIMWQCPLQLRKYTEL